MPGFIKPALATMRTAAPTGKHWAHEIDYAGQRAQAHLDAGGVAIFTGPNGEANVHLGWIATSIAQLPANKLILDGEIAGIDAGGRPIRSTPVENISDASEDRLVYFAFDMLHLDGFDLCAAPFLERKRVLKSFLEEARPTRIHYSEHLVGAGADVMAEARRMKLGGIISKRTDAPYRSGETDTWLKINWARRRTDRKAPAPAIRKRSRVRPRDPRRRGGSAE